jgi:hypothetical protein
LKELNQIGFHMTIKIDQDIHNILNSLSTGDVITCYFTEHYSNPSPKYIEYVVWEVNKTSDHEWEIEVIDATGGIDWDNRRYDSLEFTSEEGKDEYFWKYWEFSKSNYHIDIFEKKLKK